MSDAFTVSNKPIEQTPFSQEKLDKYILMEQLRSRLMSDRSPYDTLFADISSILDPHMVIQEMYQAGFPDFVSDLFITSKHVQSFDDLTSGLQEGIFPIASPWIRYGLMDEESPLMDNPKVWQHLHQATREVQSILNGSNFYEQIPMTLSSTARFGTGAIMMERDEDDFVRFTSFPIGSYYISNNNKGQVDTFCRMFRYTVRQTIEEFCSNKITKQVDLALVKERCSDALQLQWDDPKRHEEWVDIVMFVFPNPEFDYFKAYYDSKYARYSLNYYEMARNIGHKMLREEGFRYFPIYCPRWYRQPTDAYGVNCPGAKARADVRRMFKSIQMFLLSAQKLLEPPMGADPSVVGGVSGNGAGTTPNFLTVIPGGVGPDKKFAPIYQLDPAMLTPIGKYIEECKADIDRLCYADIFRRFANDQRQTPPTATEVLQRVQEDARVIGTIFGLFNYGHIQPMGRDLYYMMIEDRMIPPAPQEMHSQKMSVQVTSRIAIALKQNDINALNAGIGMATQIATLKSTPGTEAINGDEMMDQGFRLLNLPPKLLYSQEQRNKIRQQQIQMRQQQQQMVQQQHAAKTAKDLSDADTGGDTNLLQKMMENQQGGGPSAT